MMRQMLTKLRRKSCEFVSLQQKCLQIPAVMYVYVYMMTNSLENTNTAYCKCASLGVFFCSKIV